MNLIPRDVFQRRVGRLPGSIALLIGGLFACHAPRLANSPERTPERLSPASVPPVPIATGGVDGSWFAQQYYAKVGARLFFQDPGTHRKTWITSALIMDLGSSANWISDGETPGPGYARIPKTVKQVIPLDSIAIDDRTVTVDGSTVAVRDMAVNHYVGIMGGEHSAGLLGTSVLWHYDMLVDGSQNTSALFTKQATSWLPVGITPADCAPFQRLGRVEDHFAGLTLQANGHALPTVFASGFSRTVMTWAAAAKLGLTRTSPQVRFVTAAWDDTTAINRPDSAWVVTGIPLTVGRHRLREVPIYINNADASDQQPLLRLGFDAVRDRLVWVSYGKSQVCVSDSLAAPTSRNLLFP